MTERKAIKYDLIAGILFAVLALHALTGISFSGILYNSFGQIFCEQHNRFAYFCGRFRHSVIFDVHKKT